MTASAPLRILVVEDEALILMATIDMLDELGHQPIRARNAEMALAALDREGRVDVLLTDINLPDRDGHALVEDVRRRFPGMPVIFATGYRVKLSPDAGDRGPTAVLSKPYLTSELVSALRDVTLGLRT